MKLGTCVGSLMHLLWILIENFCFSVIPNNQNVPIIRYRHVFLHTIMGPRGDAKPL